MKVNINLFRPTVETCIHTWLHYLKAIYLALGDDSLKWLTPILILVGTFLKLMMLAEYTEFTNVSVILATNNLPCNEHTNTYFKCNKIHTFFHQYYKLQVGNYIFQLLLFNIDEKIESNLLVSNKIHSHNTRANNRLSILRVNRFNWLRGHSTFIIKTLHIFLMKIHDLYGDGSNVRKFQVSMMKIEPLARIWNLPYNDSAHSYNVKISQWTFEK